MSNKFLRKIIIKMENTNLLLNKKIIYNSGSGMEFIWKLQDFYEEKKINKFLGLVSWEFRKGFLKFKEEVRSKLKDYRQLKLYIHLNYTSQSLYEDIYLYEICWTKRLNSQQGYLLERNFGKATIALKKYHKLGKVIFLLMDIYGDNPFV